MSVVLVADMCTSSGLKPALTILRWKYLAHTKSLQNIKEKQCNKEFIHLAIILVSFLHISGSTIMNKQS